jgi:hypothetical protein
MRKITIAGRCRGPARGRGNVMQTLGWVTAITAAVAAVTVGVLVVLGLPDLRRYMRIRKM